ncbi:unnamed protein product, partial [Polarella glacialis]
LLVRSELMDSGSSETAMQTAKEVVDRFRGEGDRRNEALALQTVARTHIAKKEYLRAARVAQDAQKILSELGDTQGEIEMLRTAVDAHLARPEKDGKEDALRVATDALSSFHRAGNGRGEALGLSILAQVYVQRLEPETAVHVVRDAVALLRKLGDRKAETDLLRAIINSDLIPESIESGDQALRAVKAALAVCHLSDDKRGQAVMLRSTFRILLAREKPERALQAAEEALKLFKELQDVAGEADISLLLAKTLIAREDLKRALATAQRAAVLFREAGDKAGEMASLQA